MNPLTTLANILLTIAAVLALLAFATSHDTARNAYADCVHRLAQDARHPNPYGREAWEMFGPACK